MRFVETQDFTTAIHEHIRAFELFQGLPATCLYDNMKVVVTSQTPPRTGWLDELGRLKRRSITSPGVALKRAYVDSLELPVCSVRALLRADVLPDLLQFKPNRRNSVSSRPEMFAPEIPLLAAQPGDGNRALPFEKPDHRSHRMFRRNCEHICTWSGIRCPSTI